MRTSRLPPEVPQIARGIPAQNTDYLAVQKKQNGTVNTHVIRSGEPHPYSWDQSQAGHSISIPGIVSLIPVLICEPLCSLSFAS
jgi:hypothetical protein